MGRLEDVPVDELEELVEDLSDLRHDLGKYILFETRFLEEQADLDARRAALRKDLTETHRHRGKVQSCWQVWARLRPAELDEEPEVGGIDAALVALEACDLDGDADALDAAVVHARTVQQLTRQLLDRVRDHAEEHLDEDDLLL